MKCSEYWFDHAPSRHNNPLAGRAVINSYQTRAELTLADKSGTGLQ